MPRPLSAGDPFAVGDACVAPIPLPLGKPPSGEGYLARFVNLSWEPYLMSDAKTDSESRELHLLRRHAPIHRGARAVSDRPHAAPRHGRATLGQPHPAVRGSALAPRRSLRGGAGARNPLTL